MSTIDDFNKLLESIKDNQINNPANNPKDFKIHNKCESCGFTNFSEESDRIVCINSKCGTVLKSLITLDVMRDGTIFLHGQIKHLVLGQMK